MSENIAQAMQQDRVFDLVRRNNSMAQSLMGATRAIVRLCDARGWAPAALRFQTPHLDARGWLRFRFWSSRRGRSGYRDTFSAGEFTSWMGGRNAVVTDFFQQCRTFRRAIEDTYHQSFAFAAEKGRRFEDIDFGVFRFGVPGNAWVRIHVSHQQRVVAESRGE